MFFVIGNIFKVKAVSHMACVSFVDVLNRIGGRVKLLPPQQIFFRRTFMIWFGMIQTIHVSGVELMFRNRNYSQKHSFWRIHSIDLALIIHIWKLSIREFWSLLLMIPIHFHHHLWYLPPFHISTFWWLSAFQPC